MLGLHLRSAPLLETWQHVLHLVAGGHSLDHAAGGHVLVQQQRQQVVPLQTRDLSRED